MIWLLNIQHHYLLCLYNLSQDCFFETILVFKVLASISDLDCERISQKSCLEDTRGRHLVQLPAWSRTVANTRSSQQWLLLVKSWDFCDLSSELFWGCTTFLARALVLVLDLVLVWFFFRCPTRTLQATVWWHCLPLFHLALPRIACPHRPYNCSS